MEHGDQILVVFCLDAYHYGRVCVCVCVLVTSGRRCPVHKEEGCPSIPRCYASGTEKGTFCGPSSFLVSSELARRPLVRLQQPDDGWVALGTFDELLQGQPPCGEQPSKYTPFDDT